MLMSSCSSPNNAGISDMNSASDRKVHVIEASRDFVDTYLSCDMLMPDSMSSFHNRSFLKTFLVSRGSTQLEVMNYILNVEESTLESNSLRSGEVIDCIRSSDSGEDCVSACMSRITRAKNVLENSFGFIPRRR